MKSKRVLVVSNNDDRHADIVCTQLQQCGIAHARLNTDELMTSSFTWHMETGREQCTTPWDFDTVTDVWFRKVRFAVNTDLGETSVIFAEREQQELLDSVLAQLDECRWINHPQANKRAGKKLDQLVHARRVGLTIPATLATTDLNALAEFFLSRAGDIVVKPQSAQLLTVGGRTHALGTRSVTIDDLPHCVHGAPCFAQERLSVAHEMRVIIFGEHCFAFEMHRTRRVDDIKQLSLGEIEHVPATLDRDTEASLRALMRHYGLLFATFDLVVVPDGTLYFLEINPNGQWLWLEYMTGVDLLHPFVDFLVQ